MLTQNENGILVGVPSDLTYHISLKQQDYNVMVLNSFNTHVLYEIVITSRILRFCFASAVCHCR